MIDLKSVRIENYYLADNIIDKIKNGVHFISEKTEDTFIDIYLATNSEEMCVVLYYEDCQLSCIDSFFLQPENDATFVQNRIEGYLKDPENFFEKLRIEISIL